MKKQSVPNFLLGLLALTGLHSSGVAQQVITKGNATLGAQVVLYRIERETPANTYKTVLVNGKDVAKRDSFVLNEYDEQAFRHLFVNALGTLNLGTIDPEEKGAAASKVYMAGVLAMREAPNVSPRAGLLALKKKVVKMYSFQKQDLSRENYLKKKETDPLLDRIVRFSNVDDPSKECEIFIEKKYEIDSIHLEFCEAMLKNAWVMGWALDENGRRTEPVMFRNYVPIAFASLKNITESDIILYETVSYEFAREARPTYVAGAIKEDKSKSGQNEKQSTAHFLWFTDVLSYIPQLATFQEDYSPKDHVMVLRPGKPEVVFKEENAKLLSAKIFTDLAGVDGQSPNGLIQTEFAKKIVLNPDRRSWLKPINRQNTPDSWFGYFNYVEPKVLFAKIEENNKYLPVRYAHNPGERTTANVPLKKMATILDLMRYQNFNFGGTINAFFIDKPNLKSSFFFNLGLGMFRTGLEDSPQQTNAEGVVERSNEVEKINVNSGYVAPEFVWQIKSDTRFGFTATWRWNRIFVRDDRITPIYDTHETEHAQKSQRRWVNSVILEGFVRPPLTNNGHIFARLSYNCLRFDKGQNFFQAQMGYSFNLLTRVK